jgi:hypothetical protein
MAHENNDYNINKDRQIKQKQKKSRKLQFK